MLNGILNGFTFAQTYSNLPMGGAGFVSGIVYSKSEANLKYIRTDVGGAYIWNQPELKWEPLLDWVSSQEVGYLGVESLALDPSDPDKLYMSVGTSYFNGGKSAILRSSDRGKTFSLTDVTSLFKIHGNGMGRNTGEKLAVDPNLGSVLFCGSRDNGLFKSADSGSGWSRVSSLDITTTATGNGISFVIFDPSSGSAGTPTQTLVVGVSRIGSCIYRSDDGGATFLPVTGAPTTLMPNRAALASDGNLFITFTNAAGPWDPNTGQIWKYNLSSGTWTNITPAGYSFAFGGISVDPTDPMRIVASSINVYRSQGGNQWGDVIFLSNNGGASWVNKITSGYKLDPNNIEWAKNGVAIHWAGCIEFDPFNLKRVSVNSGNGLFTTDNIDSVTNVWKFDVHGLEESVPMDLISIPGGPVVTVIGDYDGFRYTDITKYGTQNLPAMGSTNGLAFAALNPAVVVRSGGSKDNGGKMYISTDTAKTWKATKINGWQGYLSLSANGNILLHSPDQSIITYRSADGGETWSPVNGLSQSGARTVADAVNSSVFYSYNSGTGRVYTSIDEGKNFYGAGTPGGGGSKHIRTVPGYEGNLWIALNSGGLARSIDYGASFVKMKNVTSCSAVGLGKSLPGNPYPVIYIWGVVGGTEGLFFSTNEGLSWTRMNDDNHEWGGTGNGQFVIGDMNRPGIAYISTAGRGIIYAKPDYMLSLSKLSLEVDSTAQLFPIVLNGPDVNWTYSSSDSTVAVTDSNGLVTAKSFGDAIITGTNSEAKSLTIEIRVVNPVRSISISPEVDSIDVSETVQLTATVSPVDATYPKVTWSSTNTAVASVSNIGVLKGFKTGRAVISALSDNMKTSFLVVVGIPISELSIDPAIDTIKIQETKQLNPVFVPFNTTENKLKWSSSQTSVATVDSKGLVTGKAPGTTDIIASSNDVVLQAVSKITVEAYAVSVRSDITEKSEVIIFPNPLKGKILTIDMGGLKEKTDIQFADALGRIVMEKHVYNRGELQIETNFRPGIYMVRVSSGENVVVKKLIIEN